jgi:exo-beta-1,3-glucanase (GH17 family)
MRVSTTVLVAGAFVASSSGQTLHRSFFGIAYSPDGVILPECGAVQSQVTADIVDLAQLTPRIRLYGSDCNQTALVLQGIQDAGNVDLSVWVGIYIDGNDTVYQRQMDAVVSAIKTYGTDHIAGITVGNEYLLDSYGTNGNANNTAGVAARTMLLNYIQEANKTIQGLSLSKSLPIGTADAGSALTLPLCEGVDYFMANVHPWFGDVSIDDAAVWTWQFFQDFDVDICAQATNKPSMYIAETGWPTQSMNASEASDGPSIASVGNLQKFIDTFTCQANSNGTQYFFFEFMDETWKEIYGGVEPYWGLYNANRTLKDITIPNCTVTSPTSRQVVDSATSSSGSNSSSSTGKSEGSRSYGDTFGLVASVGVLITGLTTLL